MVPREWTVHDNSYMPDDYTDTLPGGVEVQFIAPSKDGTAIVFTYRGRSVGNDDAALFHQVCQAHTEASKSGPLTKEQIQQLTGIFGTYIGNNQYAAELGQSIMPPQFKMTSAEVVSINGTTPALAIKGEWRNDPKTTPQAEKYWYKVYLDGTGDGKNVHEILYTSDTLASFDKNKPVFDQLLDTLSW